MTSFNAVKKQKSHDEFSEWYKECEAPFSDNTNKPRREGY